VGDIWDIVSSPFERARDPLLLSVQTLQPFL
jgi:hypothetical protein